MKKIISRTFEINIKKEITEDHVSNVIVGALEGGSNYWYLIDTKEAKGIPARKNDGTVDNSLSMRISKGLMENPDFSLPVRDIENPEDVLGFLTKEKMKKAFEIAASDYPVTFNNIITESEDADDADIIFQLAVMGELVFG